MKDVRNISATAGSSRCGTVLVLAAFLACLLLLAPQRSWGGPGPGGSAFDRLLGVEAWEVSLHLVYDDQYGNTTEHTTSEWTGILRTEESMEGHWYADLDVVVDGTWRSACDSHGNAERHQVHAKEKYNFALRIHEDGYEFGQGYCNTDPGNGASVPEYCTRCSDKPPDPAFVSVNYSRPWRVRRPLPGGLTLSGSETITSGSAVQAEPPLGKGQKITVAWEFRPAGRRPELEAVPVVASTVERGETVLLDGSKSTGNVQKYTWTFKSRAASGEGDAPNEKAEKSGAAAAVVLLDSMDVTLTVSDGTRTDSRTVAVSVTPRSYFRTPFEHASPESYLPDGAPPVAVESGMNAKHKKTYDASWIGAENVCAHDPPGSGSDEAPHILHPDPAKASKDELYTLATVSDPDGPWDGFFYFSEWKVDVKRRTRINSYIVESGPPQPGLGGQSFYTFNQAHGGDVAGYLKAVRDHEMRHSELMAEALRDGDPAKNAEKAFGKDEEKLRKKVETDLRDAGKKLHDHAKDPLPESWRGSLALPVKGKNEWVLIETSVGGEGYGSF